MRPILIAALMSLAACDQPIPSLPPLDAGSAAPPPVAAAPDSCGAAGLQVLVGQNVALFEAQARTGPARILRLGQAVTMDYSDQRVNVAVDAADRITRITCG